ncbi:MAG: hypothetical protein ABFS14_06515 [Gemmatimonadota bacterium]
MMLHCVSSPAVLILTALLPDPDLEEQMSASTVRQPDTITPSSQTPPPKA